jgi:hypothetical protein
MLLSSASYLISAVWAGIIIGISFIAQPSKFKTPQLPRPIALATGRQIFHSMHKAESILAIAGVACNALKKNQHSLFLWFIPVFVLIVQMVFLMPSLSARVDQVLAGHALQKSWHHLLFAILEMIKLLCLFAFLSPMFSLTTNG